MKYIYIGLILVLSTTNSFTQNMEKVYKKAVAAEIKKINSIDNSILNEQDMAHLPVIVQKYLRFVGAVDCQRII